MNKEDKHDSTQILLRRTEKQWRHEERVLSSTHALWSTLIGLQGAVAGLAGVLVGQGSFSELAFIIIGTLSLLSIAALAWLNFLSREADRLRAEYFAETSKKGGQSENFNQELENEKSKSAESRYKRTQNIVERVVILVFFLNAIVFGWVTVSCG